MNHRIAAGEAVRWPSATAAGNASVGLGEVAGAVPRMVLLPLLGGLLAVVGSLLLVAEMMDSAPLPISARAAAAPAIRAERPGPIRPERDGWPLVASAHACANGTRPVPPCQAVARAPGLPLAIGAPHVATEHYRGEGRTLDLLVATLPADMRAAMLAAMARAHHASREVQESDGLASAPSTDLRSDLAAMAEAQRAGRWSGSCPCPMQGGAIRCPANTDRNERIARALLGSGFSPERSRPSDQYPCRMHSVV